MIIPLTFFNSIFGPLMAVGGRTTGALLSVLVLDLFFALALALIYKFLMNQKEAKKIKENVKELRNKVNESKKDNDIKKMNSYMRQSVELNNKLLRMSLKPMIASLILVMLIFPWVHQTFNPEIELNPMNDSLNGTFEGQFSYQDLNISLIYNEKTEKINFTGYGTAGNRDYVQVEDTKWQVKSIKMAKDGESVNSRISLVFVNLPFYLPLVDRSLEWLGYYFWISIPLTYAFRKLLKVA